MPKAPKRVSRYPEFPTSIRLPGDLKAWLQKKAAAMRRPLTFVMIEILETYKKWETMKKPKEEIQNE